MPLKDEQKQAKAMDLVAQAHANRKPSNLRIKQQQSVFGGTLFVVAWHSDTDNRDTEHSVFFKGDEPHFFWTPLDLVKFLDESQQKYTLATLLREIFTVGGAASVIAIIITVTICYVVAIRGMEKVPEVLGAALTMILGFYFGSKAKSASAKKN
jgi:hypothetical protein